MVKPVSGFSLIPYTQISFQQSNSISYIVDELHFGDTRGYEGSRVVDTLLQILSNRAASTQGSKHLSNRILWQQRTPCIVPAEAAAM